MSPAQLKTARRNAGWTQHHAASRLAVSQPYYSQLEKGTRIMTESLTRKAVRKFHLSPAMLPLPKLAVSLTPMQPDALATALAQLGYPGFTHLWKAGSTVNPAELVARALVHSDLDTRLVEALPWVLSHYHDLEWDWLSSQCRLSNLQNRLGFLLSLALQLAKPEEQPHLVAALSHLEPSRLSAEGTLCRDSMPLAERHWVRKQRSDAAAHWNMLTTLTVDQLTHAT